MKPLNLFFGVSIEDESETNWQTDSDRAKEDAKEDAKEKTKNKQDLKP